MVWKAYARYEDFGRWIGVYLGRLLDDETEVVTAFDPEPIITRRDNNVMSHDDPPIRLDRMQAEVVRDALLELLPLKDENIPSKVEDLYKESLEKERARVDMMLTTFARMNPIVIGSPAPGGGNAAADGE